jgi:Fe-S oxidoreductase
MCPSYQVTREEKDSTRGRAHLLFEMMNGEVLTEGWKSDAVKDSLDLCLACKGCKGDCPVQVDMATYKAEFYSHYYEGRLRPRYAYAMGLIHIWARLASKVPALATLVTQTPLLSRIAKWLGGITPERKLPPFAPQTFKDWFFKRSPRNVGQPQVLLWPDTFNNYFHPEVGKATVEVLERAGFHVVLPQQSLCCGRPLYDFGMLDTAKGLLRQILLALRPYIEAGTPLVGMEPSCTAVFRDEMVNLFPHDEDARRLAQQTYLLSEFLEQKASNWQIPQLHRKAIVHGHCHHKAIMKMTAEQKVLDRLGLDYELLDTGCCGMAGSFGFEEDKFDISQAVGELAFLPKIREASPDELIIANGFSCLTQIEDLTERQGLHLAQVLQMAINEGPHGTPGSFPERQYPKVRGVPNSSSLGTGLAFGAGLLLGGLLVRHWMKNHRHEGDGSLEQRGTARGGQPARMEL